jgi:hypothetical protein
MGKAMGSCYQKAQKTCSGYYEVIDAKINSMGINRKIKFQPRI